MKKMLCLILALVMALSLAVPAMAEGYHASGNGTDVSYSGSETKQDPEDPDSPPYSDTYTIEVPMTMKPNSTDVVKYWGTWASQKKLTVTSDETVTLTNSDNAAAAGIDLNVTFEGIEEFGNDFTDVAITTSPKTEDIAVSDFAAGQTPRFGTWSGKINYTVTLA